MKTIRVGIIGQGRSGRDIHGVYLKTDRRYRIIAVSDRLADRRRRAVAEYGCAAHADYCDLLRRRDIDLVVNATPSHQHVPVTLAALRAGHHVLCEKPLAKRVRDVDRLIVAARRARKVLAVFQQSRYAPYFQQVRRVIDSGVLGRVVQISIAFNGFARRWDWQTLRRYHGGNLMNTGPHPLDQALVLFGDGKPRVTCFMDRTDGTWGDAENHVKLILSGRGHPLIDLEISSCCGYPQATYRVYGTRGGLTATMANAEWKYFRWSAAPRQRLTTAPLRGPDGTPVYPQEHLPWRIKSWPSTTGQGTKKAGYAAATAATRNLTQALYAMLYRTIARGARLEITPEQVRRQVAVIEECHRQNPQVYRRGRQGRSGAR